MSTHSIEPSISVNVYCIHTCCECGMEFIRLNCRCNRMGLDMCDTCRDLERTERMARLEQEIREFEQWAAERDIEQEWRERHARYLDSMNGTRD